jgi:opacity protein-like surface antigen
MMPVIVVLIMLLSAPQISHAQSSISFGGRLGLNLASIKATYDYSYDYYDYNYYGDELAAAQSESNSSTTGWRPGFAISGFVNIPYNERISFQPELSFLQRGHRDSENEMGFRYESSMTLNYLEIPLLVRYSFPTNGKISPAITAGPTVGFLLGMSAWEKLNGVKEEIDYSEFYRTTSFGIVLGAGVEYALPLGKVMFDIRYDLGLSNLIDGDFDDYSEKSRALLFAIGFGL